MDRHDAFDLYARQLEVPELSNVRAERVSVESRADLIDWYCKRAKEIEQRSGLVQHAILFVSAALEKCEEDERLKALLWDLKAYRYVIYDLEKVIYIAFLYFESHLIRFFAARPTL